MPGRDVVTLGSLGVRVGDRFLPTARGIVAREWLPGKRGCPIVAAGLQERLGDVAAICTGMLADEAA